MHASIIICVGSVDVQNWKLKHLYTVKGGSRYALDTVSVLEMNAN